MRKSPEWPIALGTAAHADDLFHAFTFTHAFAVIMEQYMKTHGWTEEQFAVIPPIFYDNAQYNPLSHMNKTKVPITPEVVAKITGVGTRHALVTTTPGTDFLHSMSSRLSVSIRWSSRPRSAGSQPCS